MSASKVVVLNQTPSSGHIWQTLEAILVVTIWVGVYYSVEARGGVKHPTIHRTKVTINNFLPPKFNNTKIKKPWHY